MKTEQEKIEEMAKDNCTVVGVSCKECEHKKFCATIHYSEKFYNKGYRKASDVIDEFVKKIICRLSYDRDSELYGKTKIVLTLNKVASEMRQEVEKP